jgi:uncharacterized protein (DUF305 family)
MAHGMIISIKRYRMTPEINWESIVLKEEFMTTNKNDSTTKDSLLNMNYRKEYLRQMIKHVPLAIKMLQERKKRKNWTPIVPLPPEIY